MALKATVYKAQVELADIDNHIYESLNFTLARHPSETEERLMLRLLAKLIYAENAPEFGRGLSNDDEPDLWSHTDSGEITLWVSLGTPDPKWLKRASGRTQRLEVITYGGRAVPVWLQKNAAELRAIPKASFWQIDDEQMTSLGDFADKTMSLSATIQEGQVHLSDQSRSLSIELQQLKP